MAGTDHSQIAKVSVGAAVLIIEHGKILLVQEKKPTAFGKWNFPGGRVDTGESFEEAAIREAKEETGYDVELDQALPILHESIDHSVVHPFAVHVVGGELQFPEDEILDAKWFTVDEIRSMTAELRVPSYMLSSIDALNVG